MCVGGASLSFDFQIFLARMLVVTVLLMKPKNEMLDGSASQMYNLCLEGVTEECMPTVKRKKQALNCFAKPASWNALSVPELGEN